jgi:hypothetical protein
VILSSFSVANTESNASWSFDTYEEPRGSEARHQISGKNALIEMFFQRFSDPARFSCFQLLPLEAPAMTEFLQEYFEIDETNYVIDPYEFEKILDACGGIPLYAIELMKPLLAKCKCSSGAAQKKRQVRSEPRAFLCSDGREDANLPPAHRGSHLLSPG